MANYCDTCMIQANLPYSTEITPTLIACYKAATGGMGLISKTVVLPRNLANPGVCLEITSTHEETMSFLSAPEACQLLKYNAIKLYNNSNAWVK